MVIKIQPPSGKTSATIAYNERKTEAPEGIRPSGREPSPGEAKDKEKGHILATRGVPEGTTLEQEMNRLKELNAKTQPRQTKNNVFHMSVNPGEDDLPMDEEQTAAFIDELMTGLGYANCPYRIYKHTDIERTHYHVVASRIDKEGRKIKDSFEERRANHLCETLGKKYGFVMGRAQTKNPSNEEDSEDEADAIEHARKRTTTNKPKPHHLFARPFDRRSATPVTDQIAECHRAAMGFAFSTPEQYEAIMREQYSILAIKTGYGYAYAGLSRNGEIVTPYIMENECIGKHVRSTIKAKAENERMSEKRWQKNKTESAAMDCAERATTYTGWLKEMKSAGVLAVTHFSADGKPFGLTFINTRNKCAFKGSEVRTNLSWLKRTAEEKGWTITQPAKHQETQEPAQETKGQDAKTRHETIKKPTLTQRPGADPIKKLSGNGILSALLKTKGNSAHVSATPSRPDGRNETEEEKRRRRHTWNDEEEEEDNAQQRGI